mmetsp:Transcript_29987/g.69785  ORF Transcript_29987/g.69785 Transcript_29987/m.69785 type:complete len:401 (+) Transcript_29987:71-1273(+)
MSSFAGKEYWIVAAKSSKTNTKETQFALLKSRINDRLCEEGFPPAKFDVPEGEQSLKFGSFDNLIRLTDELQKYDTQVEAILRRLERQSLEIDPGTEFKVHYQRNKHPFNKYIGTWQWDDAKFPKSRGLSDNLSLLLTVVNKLDEEARLKSAAYNELKTQKGNISKKAEGQTLMTKDLVDVLTPDVVTMTGSPDDDFIMTEHITTVVVVVPRGGENDFMKTYESMQENVVPKSAKKFKGLDDKDGNSIWRVLMFKSAVEGFKKTSRDHRFTVRDFVYSEEGYKKLVAQRAQIEDECAKQLNVLRSVCEASWSEVMVAWVHIKAMRVFVESVLRYGVPPQFAAFIIQPKAGQTQQMRKALADIFGKQGGPGIEDKMAEAADDGEEYYPYVSLSFTPFQARA